MRAARNENVAVDLDNLFGRQSVSVPLGASVEIVDILGDEQKLAGFLREFHDGDMRGIRLCAANPLTALAIPIPN